VSYQVIARKYRPQTFAELTGQEHISRTLCHALEQRRLHHAYLFSGVRGTGKTTSARILAKGLNCQSGVTSQPCLKCPSCLEIATGNSLDVLEIDAASNTGVDNVRDVIINNIALAPARDRYKVFVIDEVHMLSNSAFNALLKTLEEPPGHVVFMLATTELHKVPDTILSRCQQFEFRQIPSEKIFQRLRDIAAAEQINISDTALRELARAGAGSLRDAQSAFDQVIAFSGDSITEEDVAASLGLVGARSLAKFAEAHARQDVASILALLEEIGARGYDLRNFTRELMTYWRNLLVVKSGITSGEILGVADLEISKLQELSRHFSEEDLVRGFHLLAETEKEVKDSPHPRFQLEIGLVKLAQTPRLRSLAELIERLEQLEGNLLKGGGNLGGKADVRPQVTNNPTPEAPGKPPIKLVEKPREAAATRAHEEPPDFPDDIPLDDAPPEDFADFEPMPAPKPRPTKTTPSKSVAAPAPRPTSAPSPITTVAPGREVTAIVSELKRLNRTLLTMAFEDAHVTYREGQLLFTFSDDDPIAKRVRESGPLFREIGERLFGQPLRVEVRTGNQPEPKVDEASQARGQMQEQLSQNPAVRQILDKFKGEIISVRAAQPTAHNG
jgi:DNA polymerase-3 subunit gamma/tau